MTENGIPVYGGMFDSTAVVETVGGFPRGNKAVDAAFFAQMIACFYKDGIWGVDSLLVTPGGGLTVTVAEGIAWARGYMAWQKEPVTLSVSAGVTTRIVLRLNIPAGEFTLVATEGGAIVNESVRDLVLAEVTVPAYASAVTAAMVQDTRTDAAKCGIVTSTVDALGTVGLAEDANMLGGKPAAGYLLRAGGTMAGALRAASDATGMQVVRNIGFGTTLPDSLADGELFVLLADA